MLGALLALGSTTAWRLVTRAVGGREEQGAVGVIGELREETFVFYTLSGFKAPPPFLQPRNGFLRIQNFPPVQHSSPYLVWTGRGPVRRQPAERPTWSWYLLFTSAPCHQYLSTLTWSFAFNFCTNILVIIFAFNFCTFSAIFVNIGLSISDKSSLRYIAPSMKICTVAVTFWDFTHSDTNLQVLVKYSFGAAESTYRETQMTKGPHVPWMSLFLSKNWGPGSAGRWSHACARLSWLLKKPHLLKHFLKQLVEIFHINFKNLKSEDSFETIGGQ